MTWFIAFDRATGAAKWHGECGEAQVANHATEAIGVIPLLRKGLVLAEEEMPGPDGAPVMVEVMRIDLTAAIEALLAGIDGGALLAAALSPALAEQIEATRQAARAEVEAAMPNLALAAAAAEVDWAALSA